MKLEGWPESVHTDFQGIVKTFQAKLPPAGILSYTGLKSITDDQEVLQWAVEGFQIPWKSWEPAEIHCNNSNPDLFINVQWVTENSGVYYFKSGPGGG